MVQSPKKYSTPNNAEQFQLVTPCSRSIQKSWEAATKNFLYIIFLQWQPNKLRQKIKIFLQCIQVFLVKLADTVQNLGVWFDSEFTFPIQIFNPFASCARDLWRFRLYLTQDAVIMTANDIQMEVVLTTATHCSGVYLPTTSGSLSVFKIALPEQSQITPDNHVQLQFARSYIGFLLNLVPCLRQLYWFTSDAHAVTHVT